MAKYEFIYFLITYLVQTIKDIFYCLEKVKVNGKVNIFLKHQGYFRSKIGSYIGILFR